MKILACTDVHEPDGIYVGLRGGLYDSLMALKKKHKPDVLICCGDFSTFAAGQKEALEIFKKIKLPTFIIHGNHDDYKRFSAFCKKNKNFHNVHKSSFVHEGVLFFGWGGGGFQTHEPKFEKWGKSMEPKIKKYKQTVFLTHQPLHGTKMDIVPWGDHVGSKSLRKFVTKNSKNIFLVLSGHIHEGFGEIDKIKSTALINPGPRGLVMDIGDC